MVNSGFLSVWGLHEEGWYLLPGPRIPPEKKALETPGVEANNLRFQGLGPGRAHVHSLSLVS